MPTKNPRYRIYPSIGIARLGNGPAQKDQVVFSPEVPWGNLYETNQKYHTADGKLKKQAQRFYIYECDSKGRPIKPIDTKDYDIKWTVEVANKKPFWYDFNNSLDLSTVSKNQNVSTNFAKDALAPGIGAKRRNPNVLDQSLRQKDGPNYRKELVNRPAPVSVTSRSKRKTIDGQFPFPMQGKKSLLADKMQLDSKKVSLGTIEYDNGTLIFYGADGLSASLNPSDLNTDFADNSNWYDDICDGKVTAEITPKKGKSNKTIALDDPQSAAWVASAPPDYAPQIQPISTMYDLICGAANEKYSPELSLVFPMFYRLYRMQWVNMGDFLAPSFRETMDKISDEGLFKWIYTSSSSKEAKEVRESIFKMFRNPAYPMANEPIIPSNQSTDITNIGSGTSELLLPYYPGDAIDYPGSPAQWFAIPPMIYQQLKNWKDGKFVTPPDFDFENIDQMGRYYQQLFVDAAKDESKRPLLMTRAIMESLYGGGFHPGVELTWPMRHDLIYAENDMVYENTVSHNGYEYGFYGLREFRINAASPTEQEAIFFNDFGFQMTADDISDSMKAKNKKSWLWKITPGDLTKWMGIPWQSDAGSCQAVYVEKQYPIPAWWAANLPVHVLPEDNFYKLSDPQILDETKRYIFGSRLDWLHTANTGFIGYHAEGGYQNGLINMVYQWKNIGVVAGRRMKRKVDGIPEIVYVAFNAKKSDHKDRLLAKTKKSK